jgi:hypothetical protein
MMLRVSVQKTGQEFDLTSIADGADADGNVPHQELLLAFADSVVRRESDRAAALRPQLIEALGEEGYFDVCGVAAGFHGFTRVADSSGVPIDEPYQADAAPVQEAIGLREHAMR